MGIATNPPPHGMLGKVFPIAPPAELFHHTPITIHRHEFIILVEEWHCGLKCFSQVQNAIIPKKTMNHFFCYMVYILFPQSTIIQHKFTCGMQIAIKRPNNSVKVLTQEKDYHNVSLRLTSPEISSKCYLRLLWHS